jgi:outer membrane scaffolding protein for murein synthesis (MipA/OmpV family)
MRMTNTIARSFAVSALLAACGTAAAQTPVVNPMPDGSRDMYVGLGLQSANRYEGGNSRHAMLMPVLQAEWSNGVFVSGATAGMHWSGRAGLEFGPLLSLHPGRSERGRALTGGGLSGTGSNTALPHIGMDGSTPLTRMTGMPDVPRRLEAGAFLTWYLTPEWRLANNVLYGAGQQRDGLRAMLDLQRIATQVAPHHTLSFTAGLALADARYNRAMFGVGPDQEMFTQTVTRRAYAPGGGIKDVHAGVRWNWALAPSWMLTSGTHVARLAGDAKASPLVERSVNATVWSALAYRF